jgi:hypothetical protein
MLMLYTYAIKETFGYELPRISLALISPSPPPTIDPRPSPRLLLVAYSVYFFLLTRFLVNSVKGSRIDRVVCLIGWLVSDNQRGN